MNDHDKDIAKFIQATDEVDKSIRIRIINVIVLFYFVDGDKKYFNIIQCCKFVQQQKLIHSEPPVSLSLLLSLYLHYHFKLYTFDKQM